MDVEELEHRLSKPSAAAVDAVRGIRDDVAVLGAGGKIRAWRGWPGAPWTRPDPKPT